MIQGMVSLFRAAVVVLMLLSVLIAFALMSAGAFGFMMALGVMLAAITTFGISAVLLSINDHLAALRRHMVLDARAGEAPPDYPERTEEQVARDRKFAVGIIAALVLVMVGGFVYQQVRGSEPVDEAVVEPDSENLQNNFIGNNAGSEDGECDPRLAASVGLTCSDK